MPSVTVPAAIAAVSTSIAGSVTAGAIAAGIGEVTAGVVGSVVAAGAIGAVGGAATGALGAAVTGGNIGKGALTGGLTGAIGGGLIGGLGGSGGALTGLLGGSTTASGAVLGAGAGALGSALTGANPLQGAIVGGIGGGLTGALDPAMTATQADQSLNTEFGVGGSGDRAIPLGGSDDITLGAPPVPPGAPTGPNGDVIPDQSQNFSSAAAATKALGTDQGFPNAPGALGLNSQSSVAAQAAKGTDASGTDSGTGILSKLGLGGKTGGISDGALALGALSALSSVLNKPQQANIKTPGPADAAANLGPLFNQPLQLNPPGAGRQAVTPDIPNYYTYGQIPGGASYFNNNSLAAYGYARGGALTGPEREFRNGSGNHRVRGPGTETSDSIPARLSNNEYVLDAGDVRRIGGGSADRGAAILDRQRKKLTRGGGALMQLGRAA